MMVYNKAHPEPIKISVIGTDPISGRSVQVDCAAMTIIDAAFAAMTTLFGMDKRAILQLRRAYLEAGGGLPITDEKIARVFSRLVRRPAPLKGEPCFGHVCSRCGHAWRSQQ